MAKQKYLVLVVDDSEHDRLFLRRAILKHPRLVMAGEVPDGEAAIEYLEGRGHFQDRAQHPIPDAMLLDLKMPRMTGHEVLEWLRSRQTDGMFVAVVSGSFLPEDIARSKALGAHAYFTKCPTREEMNAMLGEITDSLDKTDYSSPS
jgi:CheY-like chemotaxis protein